MKAESETLKLLIAYDAAKNEYSVSAHNLALEEAERFIQEWNPHLLPGCSLLAVTQKKQHRTTNAQDCRTCRETVARSADIEPKPKFVRRTK
jgi:hypothetical protein